MSAEFALVSGLGIIAYLLVEIAEEVQDSESEINQGIFLLSVLFVISLEWAAYGIAQNQGFGNAELAYLVALFITLLAFLGLAAEFTLSMIAKIREDNSELKSL